MAGILVIDDSTLDKPYSQKIELVTPRMAVYGWKSGTCQ